jgi:hypothetical protein
MALFFSFKNSSCHLILFMKLQHGRVRKDFGNDQPLTFARVTLSTLKGEVVWPTISFPGHCGYI